MLAEISQMKIRAVACRGGRKKVRATIRVREKPKPEMPLKIPPKITASPMKKYKKADSSSIRNTLFFLLRYAFISFLFLAKSENIVYFSYSFNSKKSLIFSCFLYIYIYIFKLCSKPVFSDKISLLQRGENHARRGAYFNHSPDV